MMSMWHSSRHFQMTLNMFHLECFFNDQTFTVNMHSVNNCIMCCRLFSTILHNWFSSECKWITVCHCKAHLKALATAMHHAIYTHTNVGWLCWLWYSSFWSSSKYHDTDLHSWQLRKLCQMTGLWVHQALKNAHIQLKSEEWMCPTKVGSKHRRSLQYWSWSVTMVTLS